ncbi:MAG: hypothetical protein ABJB10_03330 [Mesorhizobium sp.]
MSLPPVPDAPQRRDHHFEHSYFQLNNISTEKIGNLPAQIAGFRFCRALAKLAAAVGAAGWTVQGTAERNLREGEAEGAGKTERATGLRTLAKDWSNGQGFSEGDRAFSMAD